MKQILQAVTLILSALALGAMVATAYDANTLSVTCGDVNATASTSDNGHCTEGMVTFRGQSFPENVYIKVLSYPAGRLIDDGEYVAPAGALVFTQTLVPAGGYTIRISKNSDETEVYTNMTFYTDSLN